MIILAILLCILMSAYFAGAEMTFVSANKLRLRELADQGNKNAARFLRMHDRSQLFLSAVLIGNNLANILATVLVTYALKVYFNIESEWFVALLLVPIVLIFGEILPKEIARTHADHLAVRHAFFLKLISVVFYWPSFIFTYLLQHLFPALKGQTSQSIFVTEEEFRSIVRESKQKGIVKAEEENFIHTILDFERTPVQKVMVPVEKITMIDLSTSIEETLQKARQSKVKMLLVYEEIPTLVVGMVYVFDLLLKGEGAQGLSQFLRSPVFIHKNTPLEKTFVSLQKKHQSFGVVIDDERDIVGVVPIEKLLLGSSQ